MFQPGGVVALVGDARAAIEFQNPAGDIVEEVAVVGDGDDGAFVTLQMFFEPLHGFGVEVVGGFVEDEDVGFFKQQAAEGDAALFAAGERAGFSVGGRAAEGIHGHVELAIEFPGVDGVEFFLEGALFFEELVHGVVGHGFGELGGEDLEVVEKIDDVLDAFLDDLADGFVGVHLGFLLEEADGVAGLEGNFAVELLIDAGKDFEEGGLAGTVDAQDADFGAVEVGEVDVLEEDFFVDFFADSDHGVDDFVGFRGGGHVLAPEGGFEGEVIPWRSER